MLVQHENFVALGREVFYVWRETKCKVIWSEMEEGENEERLSDAL